MKKKTAIEFGGLLFSNAPLEWWPKFLSDLDIPALFNVQGGQGTVIDLIVGSRVLGFPACHFVVVVGESKVNPHCECPWLVPANFREYPVAMALHPNMPSRSTR
jgi:hypothetical protein